MIKKYVKKLIPIEAVQYTGDNFDELQSFAGDDVYVQDGYVFVHTIEGDMKMVNKIGDYLLKGVHGEFYFCEKGIFEESYEEYQEPLTYQFTAPKSDDYYMYSQCQTYQNAPTISG